MAKKLEPKKKKKEKSILTQRSHDFLKAYINNASPTGFEREGQRLWLNYIKPYIDDQFIDNYGTAVAIINPSAPFKVVIEAHADEISWFVHYITNDGFIYLRRNGGSDHMIAPSKRVNIHTEKGIVKAVFGWPAIHVRDASKEETPALKNIFLDCGCTSKKEVEELGVHVGCVITYEDEFMVLNDRYYVGRALDNRIGGFMIAEVARLLKESKTKLPFGLYITNSVQEEVGLYVADMIADTIKPHIAAASRATGTDTDAFAYSMGGVPSALISLPLRYMHTTVESVHKDDVENVIRLIFESLKTIKNNHNFKYI